MTTAAAAPHRGYDRNHNHPCCRARFECGREGLFRLDTGSANTVSFHAPAVERLKLLEDRKTTTTLEGGVGGFAPSRRGALDWFELGGHRFSKPQVSFSQATKGAFVDEYTLGTLGQAFLKEFRVVFWYQDRKIAFVKKA